MDGGLLGTAVSFIPVFTIHERAAYLLVELTLEAVSSLGFSGSGADLE